MLESYSFSRWIICSSLPEKIRARMAVIVGMTNDKNIRIKRNVFIENTKKVKFGKGCLINHGVHLYTGLSNESYIIVGDNVAIGLDAVVTTNSHEIGDAAKRWGNNNARSIKIGSGVWIGARAVILPGVTIGEGGIIAAGAVVISDTEPNCVYAGVPVKRIKELRQ